MLNKDQSLELLFFTYPLLSTGFSGWHCAVASRLGHIDTELALSPLKITDLDGIDN